MHVLTVTQVELIWVQFAAGESWFVRAKHSYWKGQLIGMWVKQLLSGWEAEYSEVSIPNDSLRGVLSCLLNLPLRGREAEFTTINGYQLTSKSK